MPHTPAPMFTPNLSRLCLTGVNMPLNGGDLLDQMLNEPDSPAPAPAPAGAGAAGGWESTEEDTDTDEHKPAPAPAPPDANGGWRKAGGHKRSTWNHEPRPQACASSRKLPRSLAGPPTEDLATRKRRLEQQARTDEREGKLHEATNLVSTGLKGLETPMNDQDRDRASKTYKRLVENFLRMLCDNREYFVKEVAVNRAQAGAWRELAEQLRTSGNTMVVKQFVIDKSRLDKLTFLLSDGGIVLSDVGKVVCGKSKRVKGTDDQIADLCAWYESEVAPTAS